MTVNFYSNLEAIYNNGYEYLSHYSSSNITNKVMEFSQSFRNYLKTETTSYSVATLALCNLIFIYSAIRISRIVSPLITKLTGGYLPEKLTALPLGVTIIAAANYGLYHLFELNQPLEMFLGVPLLTYALYMTCHKLFFINRNKILN